MAELFQNFELHRSPWWQRVWRIAVGSVLLHTILVATVLYVPSLREAFNIASVFSEAKYVDEDYKKTIVGERAVLINAKDVFEYPPGYFSTPVVDQTLAPQVIATATPVPLPPPPPPVRQPKVKPTPAEAVAKASPSPSPQATPSEDLTAGITESMSKEEQDKKLNDIAAKSGIERPNEDLINKKPLKDWLAMAKEKKDKNEINLQGVIEMTVEAEVGPDGKLLNPAVTSQSGDPKLQELVREFVSALGDSKALAFLKDIKKIKMVVSLNEKDVNVKVSSEVETTEKASKMAGGFNAMLFVGRIKKRGETEGIIYQNTKVSSNGKAVEVKFTMPRKEATDILTKLSTS
ncbi:MAG TPA: hypothetical protein VJS44_15340 [Pyrinomonadaceae bacterium]|nr:hypothetical protein [Pyrinomonadaceae bacterium]